MENNYMIIFSIGVRVPLLAKDGIYKLKCGRRVVNIPACVERWMLCGLYLSDQEEFCWWVRANYCENISTTTLDDLITQFFTDHPSQEIDNLSASDAPLYATDTEDLEVPLPIGYKIDCLNINRETEKYWLSCALNTKKHSFDKLKDVIIKHCRWYGYSFPSSTKYDVYADIAISFLKQHGLYAISGYIYFDAETEEKLWPTSIGSKILNTVLCLVMVCFGVLGLIDSTKEDGFLSFFLYMAGCFFAVGGTILLFVEWFSSKPKYSSGWRRSD